MQINLPQDVQALARARAAEQGYASVDEYLAGLIEADSAIPVSAELEAEILAGLATPAAEVTPHDWSEARRRFRESRSASGAP